MKRSSMQQAFVGEPDRSDDFETHGNARDQAILEVRSGTVSLVVDAETPDDRVFEEYRHIQGEILLEQRKVLRFQINADDGCTVSFVNQGEQPIMDPDLNATQAGL